MQVRQCTKSGYMTGTEKRGGGFLRAALLYQTHASSLPHSFSHPWQAKQILMFVSKHCTMSILFHNASEGKANMSEVLALL